MYTRIYSMYIYLLTLMLPKRRCLCRPSYPVVRVPIHSVLEARSPVGYVAVFALGCVFHGLMRGCHAAHHRSAGGGLEETGEPRRGNKGQGKMEGNSQAQEKVTAATLSSLCLHVVAGSCEDWWKASGTGLFQVLHGQWLLHFIIVARHFNRYFYSLTVQRNIGHRVWVMWWNIGLKFLYFWQEEGTIPVNPS